MTLKDKLTEYFENYVLFEGTVELENEPGEFVLTMDEKGEFECYHEHNFSITPIDWKLYADYETKEALYEFN